MISPPFESAVSGLVFDAVGFAYDDHAVLRDASLQVRGGEVVALVGPSGAGKSTVQALAAGLLVPASGRLDRRGQVGIVPQTPTMPDTLRVVHAINAGRLRRWTTRRALASLVRPVRDLALTELAEQLRIADLLDVRVGELSGGQRQRVAVARALIGTPDVVLADEPTSAVDPTLSDDVLSVLRAAARRGAAVLVSLHDVRLAQRCCDRVIGLRGGRVVFDAPPDAIRPDDWTSLYRTEPDR